MGTAKEAPPVIKRIKSNFKEDYFTGDGNRTCACVRRYYLADGAPYVIVLNNLDH